MQVSTLLDKSSVLCQVPCSSKKIALEKISEIASKKLSIPANILFNRFIEREKIGSTGIGAGIAIPHIKIDNDLPATAVFFQCKNLIDYSSLDGNKVDLLIALLVPENRCKDYHSILEELSDKLLNRQFSRQLRHAENCEVLLELLQKE